ncbi:hypothetical protein N7495_007044 [Penicillium taxi]|uniref:uncharacterized protein n=1 Tax=Penicillium taxi TaxID=168475 RepID=UPI0025458CD9|nr:uncharacterized protein N7495_007044 [Penicillium taxi]KAJ5895353.1 hypothetical protein N7495_007044 [Penicillium taxi]
MGSSDPSSVDSTDTPYRYAAYAQRVRTIMLAAHRYVAYTSDIGESFRPVAHPWVVRSAYGISWAYLIGDVSHEGYKAYLRNRRTLSPPGEAYKDASDIPSDQIFKGMATGDFGHEHTQDSLQPWPATKIPLAEDYRMVMTKRAVFQSIASMGLPAFTIHSVVKYSGRYVQGVKNAVIRTWTPIGFGLAVVPFLPYLFDHPVEQAVDWAFGTGLHLYGGEDAVRPLPEYAQDNSTKVSPVTDATSQISWEQFKEEHEKTRELRRENEGNKSLLSWFGISSGSDGKSKKE